MPWRDRAFAASRVLAGVLALAALVSLTLRDAPGEFLIFAALVAPIAIIQLLSPSVQPASGVPVSSPSGLSTHAVAHRARNGAVRFASPATAALLGAQPQELLGQGLFERVHVADRPTYLTALDDAAALGERVSVEFRIRRGGAGEEAQFIWVEMRCRPLEKHLPAGNDANASEVVALLRDITDRKVQEQELEHARAEAERANVANGRFLATVSHELRTPLNAIIGFSELLTKEDSLLIGPERRREYAYLINESGHYLLSVVNGILDMSKIETGNFEITPEPFAPELVIADACDLLALKARQAEIALDLRIPDKLPQIVADKLALSRIMLNLVSNAIKFTPRGGRVTVAATAQGHMLTVSVEDSGVGIAAEDLARIGDPFFQARSGYSRRHEGTGLGLSIVKGLLALHGGDVGVASRLGEGTRVTFHLPLSCRPCRAEAAGVERPVPRPAEAPSQIAVRKSA